MLTRAVGSFYHEARSTMLILLSHRNRSYNQTLIPANLGNATKLIKPLIWYNGTTQHQQSSAVTDKLIRVTLALAKWLPKCLRHSFWDYPSRARSVHDRCNLCFLVNRNRRRKKKKTCLAQFAKGGNLILGKGEAIDWWLPTDRQHRLIDGTALFSVNRVFKNWICFPNSQSAKNREIHLRRVIA